MRAMVTLMTAVVLLGGAGLASAATTVSYSTGTGIVYFPATASPGTAFSLDFRPGLSSLTQPYVPATVSLTFTCQTSYSALKLQLSGDPTIYTFAPTAPATSYTAAFLYDPAYATGSGSIPSAEMPAAWKSALADGVLSGAFWVEGAPAAPQYASLSTQGAFVVPEPVSATGLVLGGMILLRRRRR